MFSVFSEIYKMSGRRKSTRLKVTVCTFSHLHHYMLCVCYICRSVSELEGFHVWMIAHHQLRSGTWTMAYIIDMVSIYVHACIVWDHLIVLRFDTYTQEENTVEFGSIHCDDTSLYYFQNVLHLSITKKV